MPYGCGGALSSLASLPAIVAEIDNNVTRFVALLIKEEAKQAEDKRKKDDEKESIAVISSSTFLNTPRRMRCSVIFANHRST